MVSSLSVSADGIVSGSDHKCDSVVRVNISWGWLGGQGPVCRALVGAGTFAHAPCQGSIDEPILLILYSLFGVPQGMV